MKKILLLCLLTLISFSCKKDKKESADEKVTKKEVAQFPFEVPKNRTKQETIYYIIRHAEKNTSDPKDEDPFLTEQGIKRANDWADYFKDKNIEQIFSSQYKRTTQTAIPTASLKQLNIKDYDSNSEHIYSKYFWLQTYGKINLIVGHSNTNPRIVNEILGYSKYDDINESVHDKIFKVVITKDLKIQDEILFRSEK
ncbi:MAG: SixA phosphatase family protein [Psychroflexus halocasei]